MPPSKKNIVMPRPAFFREHKKLIALLDSGKKFVKEAEAQRREMKRYV